MNDWMAAALGALMAGGTSAVLTPVAIRIAPRVGAMDVPRDARRLHKRPVPRAGGLAVLVGFLVGVLLLDALTSLPFRGIAALLVGAALLCLVALVDDTISLSPALKLVGQLGASAVCVMLGGGGARPWGALLAVFWLTALVNAHNMIDGLDGLAAGVGAIEGAALGAVFLLGGQTVAFSLAAVLVGSCLGFRPYNRYPARVFLGDTGSQLLGYLLGALSLAAIGTPQGGLRLLTLPLVLALPLSDLVFAVVRRVCQGKSPFAADRGHWHHRLLDRLCSQRATCVFMLLMCASLGGVGVLLCREELYPFAVYAVLTALGLVVGLGALRGQGARQK